MIGVDIIKVSRVLDLHKDFPTKVLAEEELKDYESMNSFRRKCEFLASRWACKEAFIKAYGDTSLDLKRIKTINDSKGKPHIYLDDVEYGEVSIAHDDYVVAMVSIK